MFGLKQFTGHVRHPRHGSADRLTAADFSAVGRQLMGKAIDASDYAPLIIAAESDGERGDHHRRTPPPHRMLATVFYCMIMVVNGGMCGAFGPSLDFFERQTELSQGVLGGAVMQNRLAKLGATVVWGGYATRLQQLHTDADSLLLPHQVVAATLLVSACCAAVLGSTRSGTVLQIAMTVSGFMYGISDSAANMLIMWAWDFDARMLRINVRMPAAADHAHIRHICTHAAPPYLRSRRATLALVPSWRSKVGADACLFGARVMTGGGAQRHVHDWRVHHAGDDRRLDPLSKRCRVARLLRALHHLDPGRARVAAAAEPPSPTWLDRPPRERGAQDGAALHSERGRRRQSAPLGARTLRRAK